MRLARITFAIFALNDPANWSLAPKVHEGGAILIVFVPILKHVALLAAFLVTLDDETIVD